MAKILVHSTHGSEAPSKADRAFLVAQTAIQEGHEVAMFLGGAAVLLLKDEFLDSVLGFDAKLRERYDEIIRGGGQIYLNEFSCKERGLTEDDLHNKHVKLGNPQTLVKLAVEYDRMFTYG